LSAFELYASHFSLLLHEVIDTADKNNTAKANTSFFMTLGLMMCKVFANTMQKYKSQPNPEKYVYTFFNKALKNYFYALLILLFLEMILKLF